MAAYHAKLIKAGKPIKHGYWGGGYLLFVATCYFIGHSWQLVICQLLARKVFFDVGLNLFRGLPMFYVSTTTTSIIDKLHNRLFGKRSEIYLLIYLMILIMLSISL
jgi:hypothetical protein